MVSVLLRFRDFRADINTISEHQNIIAKAGKVYWGWWRKEGIEPDHKAHLQRLKNELIKGPIKIGIYDRSTESYFTSDLKAIYIASGKGMKTPQKLNTPDYYEDVKLPAWFELHSITPVEAESFKAAFGEPPAGEGTLHPIPYAKSKPKKTKSKNTGYVKLKSNNLLHISDVHFGKDHGKFNSGIASQTLVDILSTDLKNENHKVGLIVQSGDMTSRGDGNVLLSDGLKFMRSLIKTCNIDKHHVVMIPGNHDYSLVKHDPTHYSHTKAYNTFLTRFYGSRPKSPLRKYKLANGRKLEILAIDSVKLREDDSKNYGWVDWRDYAPVLQNECSSVGDPNVLRIAVIHHHLAPAPRTENLPESTYAFASVSVTLNAGEVLEGLQKHGFSLVLHGHQHVPAVTAITLGVKQNNGQLMLPTEHCIYLVAGGSAGAKVDRLDDEFRDNAYGILSIEKDHVMLRVRRFTQKKSPDMHYEIRLNI